MFWVYIPAWLIFLINITLRLQLLLSMLLISITLLQQPKDVPHECSWNLPKWFILEWFAPPIQRDSEKTICSSVKSILHFLYQKMASGDWLRSADWSTDLRCEWRLSRPGPARLPRRTWSAWRAGVWAGSRAACLRDSGEHLEAQTSPARVTANNAVSAVLKPEETFITVFLLACFM